MVKHVEKSHDPKQYIGLYYLLRYEDELIITPVFKAHDFIHFMLLLYKPRPMAIKKEDKMVASSKSLGKTILSEVIKRYCRSPNRYILFKNFWNFVQNHVMFKNLWQNKKKWFIHEITFLGSFSHDHNTAKMRYYNKGFADFEEIQLTLN